MSVFNTAWAWVCKESGIVKTKVVAIEPEALDWAHNFIASISPVLRQAASDAVLAAVAVPGTGAVKFAAAVAAASADVAKQGIPVVENDVKAAVQIAYHGLPSDAADSAAGEAVQGAVNAEVDKLGTAAAAALAPTA